MPLVRSARQLPRILEPADTVLVVLKGPHRGEPLTAKGLEQILRGARERAVLDHATCRELRHTCLTRLRGGGDGAGGGQAQAGHRSIESTRIYLHLANDWLAGEYRKVAEGIDTQVLVRRGAGMRTVELAEPTPLQSCVPNDGAGPGGDGPTARRESARR